MPMAVLSEQKQHPLYPLLHRSKVPSSEHKVYHLPVMGLVLAILSVLMD